MGIFSEGWREKDKMTVRTNPTGEGVPVTTPSQGEVENPSLTLPKGEGNNGVVVPMAIQNEGNVVQNNGKPRTVSEIKRKTNDFPAMPTQFSSQGKGENPSLTLPKGEGNNGDVEAPNNGVVTSVPVQKEENGGEVTPVVQQATPPVVDPVLAAAQKQVADYDKQIQEMGYRFDGTDPDNMVRYLDTDAGQQAYQRLVADREKAFKYLQDIERLQADDHKYLADWSKDNFYNIITQGDGKNIPLAQAIGDYNLWASKHNGTPLDMYQIYPLLQSKDISKSFEQNVEDEKTRKRKERWQQIGNVLSHMANLYGTIHYAPSQNIEDGRQLTERQQRIWDAERRERDKNVNSFLNLWLQHQRDKARERVNEANINLTNTRNNYYQSKAGNEAAESGRKQSKLDAETRSKNAYANMMEQKGKTEEVLRPERVKTEKSKQNANNSTAYKNYHNGGSGGKGGSSTGGEDIDTKLGRIAATDPIGYKNALKSVAGPKGSLTGANKKTVLRAYENKYGNTSSGNKSLGLGLGSKNKKSRSLGIGLGRK